MLYIESPTANKDGFITQAINVGCIAINGGCHSYVHVHVHATYLLLTGNLLISFLFRLCVYTKIHLQLSCNRQMLCSLYCLITRTYTHTHTHTHARTHAHYTIARGLIVNIGTSPSTPSFLRPTCVLTPSS